jgi:hypothetical protein
MHDLKKCINNVHTNQPYPARAEDFYNRQSYDAWQKREVKQLSELLKTLTLLDPNLSMGGGEHEYGMANGNRTQYGQGQTGATVRMLTLFSIYYVFHYI